MPVPAAKTQANQSTEPAVPNLPALRNLNVFQGLRVESIRLRGVQEDSRVIEQLRDLMEQKAGEPLDRLKVRRTVQALYATGRFSNVQVEAESQSQNPKEVTLVFAVSPNYFIGSVTSHGAPSKQRPTNSQLVDASKLEIGEVLTKGKIEQAIQRMQTVLQANGFYRARIDESEKLDETTHVASVLFTITPNEPAHIGNFEVLGDSGHTPAEIAKIADMEPGHTVNQDRLTKALQRLRKLYMKQNRLESQIAFIDRKYHPDTNLLDFVVRIERGPTVDVRIEGADLGRGKLKKLVPVYEEHAVDNDLLNEGRRNIRDYLQTQGYFDAKVNFNQDFTENQDHLNVIYDVDRGEKHDVMKVDFDIKPGQYIAASKLPPYFEASELQERIQVQSKTYAMTQGRFRNLFSGLSHGRFSQAMMSDDIANLTALYRSSGFLQVKVEGVVDNNYRGLPGDMSVLYRIDEGPQTRVAHVTIEGNKAFDTDRILGLINTVEGQPYSEANLDNDRDLVLNLYFDQGFPGVQFDTKVQPSPSQPNSMDITYVIHEGQQFFVDRVITSKLNYTRPYVVDRQLAIESGNPLSQSLMSKTQANLYDLGVFNEVKMGVQNPDGNAKYKDVLLQLQEARRWTFNYGFGLEASTGQPSASDCQRLAEQGQNSVACSQGRYGVSPRVSFGVSRINFRGEAHTLTFQGSVGRLEQRALFNDEIKRWFDKPNWTFSLTGFYDNSINVTTFTSERLEGSLQLQQTYSKVSQFLYRFTYRRVKASNVVVSPDQIPVYSAPVRVGIPSFTWLRDKRDNLIDTHNGNFTSFDAGVASKYFGSQASFARFLIQNSTYHPFKRKTVAGESSMWVFARNTRIGIAEPFANTVIPLPERFLAGGSSALRGFALNQAGPRDLQTGSPLGGDALFVNSLELRTPPVAMPFIGDNLGFVFFHDIGNVFSDTTEMAHGLFRLYQPHSNQCRTDPTQCNFSYMSNAIGTGIRYHTPIGPVRVDFGYNLNPTSYPIAVTTNGVTTYTPAETRRLNFFFSIGQTF
ncbi:MAG TPA: POTRA domain-containing protein [Terriglobales bacterium]|nr:POTRA domain-containing protein [Terriglobales bacterium]